MASLPPHTPRWVIWLLNLIVIGVLVGVTHFFRDAGWQFTWGFLSGYMLMYLCVRLKYGFWPFNDD